MSTCSRRCFLFWAFSQSVNHHAQAKDANADAHNETTQKGQKQNFYALLGEYVH
jgi:hypothetical protein